MHGLEYWVVLRLKGAGSSVSTRLPERSSKTLLPESFGKKRFDARRGGRGSRYGGEEICLEVSYRSPGLRPSLVPNYGRARGARQ